MTIEISALLMVQMVNFFVAYCILRYVVFQPGIEIITSIDEATRVIERDLILGKEELERREAFNADQNERRLTAFRNRMPHEHSSRQAVLEPAAWRHIEHLTPEEETHLIAAIKESIVHRYQRRQS